MADALNAIILYTWLLNIIAHIQGWQKVPFIF